MIAEDRTASRNRAAARPDKIAELIAEYKRYDSDNGVLEIEGLADRPIYSNAAKYYEDLAFEAQLQPRAPSGPDRTVRLAASHR